MTDKSPIIKKVFRSIEEEKPGEKWAELFNGYWKDYRAWYFAQGDAARPGYGED